MRLALVFAALLAAAPAFAPASAQGAAPAPLPALPSFAGAPSPASLGGDPFPRIARWARGYARSVAFANGVGVTMGGSTFMTLDLSNPDPAVQGEVVLEGVVSDLASDGGPLVAVVATHLRDDLSGLFVVDVSDPAAPVVRGSATGFNAFSVAVQDGVAYVGVYEPDFSLRTFSLADPDAPAQLGTLSTDNLAFAVDLALDGDEAYLALGVAGLAVADISDPAQPSLLSTPVGAYAGAVAVGEVGGTKTLALGTCANCASIATPQGSVRVYDITAPAAPALLGETPTLRGPSNPQDAVWVGSDIVVPALFGGVFFIDASDPAAPAEAAKRNTARPGGTNGGFRAAYDGARLLLTDVYTGVRTTNAAQREVRRTLELPGIAYGVETDRAQPGEHFVAAGSYGVAVLALAAPRDGAPRDGSAGQTLVEVAHIRTDAWDTTTDLARTPAYLYAADGYGGVWAVDRATYAVTGNALAGAPIRRVSVTDDGAYLLAVEDDLGATTQGVLHVLSLADPAMPALVATVPDANARSAEGTGAVVWVGEDQGTDLRTYSLATPSAPALLGTTDLTGSAILLDRSPEGALYALGTGLAIDAVDVSAPAAPTVAGTAFVVDRQETLASEEGTVLLGGYGLSGLDLRDLDDPVEIPVSIEFGDLVAGISLYDGATAMVAAGHAGAYLVASPPSVASEGGPAPARLVARLAPSPASGASVLRVDLPAPGRLTVEVLDALGRRVRHLDAGEQPAGTAQVEIAAGLAPGLYLVRAQQGAATATARLTVVR